MRRRRRFAIRLVALGFAVAALSAPAAGAMPEGVYGNELGAMQSETVVSPDDRRNHGTGPVHLPAPQRANADDDSGFELSGGRLAGIGLAVLAAVMAAYAAHQAFQGRQGARNHLSRG